MISSYPDKNSLKEALSSELSMTAIKQICKENGILLLSADRNAVINAAHLFYWGYADINRFSQLMEDYKNYKKSFRISLNETDTEDGSLDEGYFNEFISLISTYRAEIAHHQDVSFEGFSVQNGGSHLKAIVEYKKKRKGRVKLMDVVSHRFSFDAFEESGKVIIDVIFDDRSSVQMAKKIFTNAVSTSKNFETPKQISLQPLTTEERIGLFDRLFTYNFSDWKIEAVKNIKVQMSETEDIPDEDAEVEEIENNFLTGIESALFSGSGLRTNPIVVDAVNRGYFFPKATIMFEHKRDAIKLLLDISFNSDELLLEVSIISTYEVDDERTYKRPMLPDDQETILQYFHSVIAEIYGNLLAERTRSQQEA